MGNALIRQLPDQMAALEVELRTALHEHSLNATFLVYGQATECESRREELRVALANKKC